MSNIDRAAQLDSLEAEVGHVRRLVEEIRQLVGPFAVPFPDGSMMVQTIYGNKYFIDPTDQIMAPQLIVYRQWEQDISQFMLSSVDSHTRFLDIGANFGYFTCLVGSRVGASGDGHVISVEPNPAMVSLLRRNQGINWSMCPIEIHECAISDRGGYVEFNVPEGRAANAGLAVGIAKGSSDQRMIVPSRSLSDIVAGRRVDLMKVDVEGFEVLVLRDLDGVLPQSPDLAIIMEWSQVQMREAGFAPADFFDVLDRFNLAAHRMPPSRWLDAAEMSQHRLDKKQLLERPYDNVLLLRNQT